MMRLSNTALHWKNKKIILFPSCLSYFTISEIKYLLQYQLIIVFIPFTGKWILKDLVTRSGWDGGRGKPFIKHLKRFLTHFASENNKGHKILAKESCH